MARVGVGFAGVGGQYHSYHSPFRGNLNERLLASPACNLPRRGLEGRGGSVLINYLQKGPCRDHLKEPASLTSPVCALPLYRTLKKKKVLAICISSFVK